LGLKYFSSTSFSYLALCVCSIFQKWLTIKLK
jgi:hypothetical protein